MIMKKIAASENIENFYQKDYIYVDKTEYIFKLIENNERIFISRPRRFGKSLTLNIIGTLFEKGVEPYFKDTWIYDKWDKETYPVLHLNFLDYTTSDIELFKQSLCQQLRNFFGSIGINSYIDDKEPNNLIRNIFFAMPDGMQIVLLIDEYDCQLTANINNPELYEKFRLFIRELYAVLKGKKQIRFIAVTGVTRLKDVSIFSVGSDIIDISYDHAYSKMIGFTRDEIKKFYLDYLRLGVSYEKHKDISEVTDSEIEEFLDRMAEQYNGFSFDEFNENTVFSTYSVNRFLLSLSMKQKVVFGDYWYENGGVPTILKNYLETHELNAENLLSSEITVPYDDFANPTTLLNINENVLMCQTGYLTLKSDINPSSYVITLGTANDEVRRSVSRLVSLRFISQDFFLNPESRISFDTCSADELISHLNKLLATVSYNKYPIKSESVLRTLLQFYFLGRALDVRVESHNSKGRSDLFINFPKRRIIIELKYASGEREEKNKLKEAEDQILENGYGLENLGDRELIRIACVFNGADDKREIKVYSIV